jgi:hypothetical protein
MMIDHVADRLDAVRQMFLRKSRGQSADSAGTVVQLG